MKRWYAYRMQETITLTLNKADQDRLIAAWNDFIDTKTPPYARARLHPENCTITVYTSGRTVFQGKDAAVYAAPFQQSEGYLNRRNVPLPEAGSDEVGTGDYFGPVCVCACIVEEKDLAEISRLGARDSKQLSDADMRIIAPQLMKLLRYSLLVLPCEKYNAVHGSNNMNMIKAKLHNQAYVNLKKKAYLPSFCIIDQFAPKDLYYRYLRNEPEIIQGIHFETKAEDHYPAVGCASVIARYAFLVAMDEMEKKYGMPFAKGAGKDVDACASRFVDRYGFDALNKVAKVHFRNTQNIR